MLCSVSKEEDFLVVFLVVGVSQRSAIPKQTWSDDVRRCIRYDWERYGEDASICLKYKSKIIYFFATICVRKTA